MTYINIRFTYFLVRECCEEEIPIKIITEFYNIVVDTIDKGVPNERSDRDSVSFLNLLVYIYTYLLLFYFVL